MLAIVTMSQWAHQIDVKMREPPLGDGDVQWLGPGVVVDNALLAVQAGLGPGCHIFGKTAEDISRRNKLLRNEFPRVGNVVHVKKKYCFSIFLAPLSRKRSWRHCQPGAEHLLGEKQW
jgi:hypothetical protein